MGKMIHWLIKTAFYSPLSFESGVVGGGLSLLASHVGYKLVRFCSPNIASTHSKSLVHSIKAIVQPIHQLELLIRDEQYGDLIQLCAIALVVCLVIGFFILHRYRNLLKKVKKKDNNSQLQAETKRLLSERKTFISKVDQLEKMNKRYREAVLLAERSYNEEHKLKRLEEKRLKNLELYMKKCSTVIAKRRSRLDETLTDAKCYH